MVVTPTKAWVMACEVGKWLPGATSVLAATTTPSVVATIKKSKPLACADVSSTWRKFLAVGGRVQQMHQALGLDDLGDTKSSIRFELIQNSSRWPASWLRALESSSACVPSPQGWPRPTK